MYTRILLTLCLFFCSSAWLSAGQLSLGKISANPDTPVRIPVLYSSHGDRVAAMQFDLSFPAETLSILSMEAGPAAATAFKSLLVSDQAPGVKRILIAGLNQNLLPDGILLTLTVRLSNAVPSGSYPLLFSNLSASDENAAIVPLTSADGLLTVVEPMTPIDAKSDSPLTDPATGQRITSTATTASAANILLRMLPAYGVPGSSASMKINLAGGGNSISGFQFDLTYDPSLFAISGGTGPAATSAGKELSLADVAVNRKRLALTGLHSNNIGDGTVIQLTIAIAANAPVGNYYLSLDNIIASDSQGQAVQLSAANGVLTIEPSSAGKATLTANPSTCTIPYGSNVCSVSLQVDNPDSLPLQLWVRGAEEQNKALTGIFSDKQLTAVLPWITLSPSTVSLYEIVSGEKRLITTVTLQGTSAVGYTASIQVDPVNCTLSASASSCRLTIQVLNPERSNLQVYTLDSSGQEVPFTAVFQDATITIPILLKRLPDGTR